MKTDERKLLAVFEQLAPEQQEKLIEFAEFLGAGDAVRDGPALAAPEILPRPAEETVTMAIRRLVRTYPMLDRHRLMAEASQFLAEHAWRGRAAQEVIDELEIVRGITGNCGTGNEECGMSATPT
ncbi:MAG: Crp/Fnr family transcriptional regulator [Betaproteobacteria bacterium]|nr:MAG: Crp/Fnr family transcriptional regulator [Betaproteobacteria bacterium]